MSLATILGDLTNGWPASFDPAYNDLRAVNN